MQQLNLFQIQDGLIPCEMPASESDTTSPPAAKQSQDSTTSTTPFLSVGSAIGASGQIVRIGDRVRHAKYWQGHIGEVVEILEVAGRYHCLCGS